MTIDFHATRPAAAEPHDEMVRFVFRSAAAASLLDDARALLGAAPRELAESFEQAVRSAGLAS
jgi:hypothetical protein